jgi:c(7)-type cytochrome triheme protein
MKNLLFSYLLISIIVPVTARAETVGGGDVTFKPKGAAPVVFSHQMHVGEKGLKCSGCHYHVFQMSKGSTKMDMRRITKGEFCGKCHSGQKAFDAKDEKNCGKCHRQ